MQVGYFAMLCRAIVRKICYLFNQNSPPKICQNISCGRLASPIPGGATKSWAARCGGAALGSQIAARRFSVKQISLPLCK
jgi:hypothetical protein